MADELSRKPARDASAQAIIDALNQVNRNVAAAREGIRRVEEKGVRTGGSVAPAGVASPASNSELERRVQLFREGRLQAEGTARAEFDHLQALKSQADEARRVSQAQQTIVTQPGYRPGGGRRSFFAEQQAAAAESSLAFQRTLGLAPAAATGQLQVIESEAGVRKRNLAQIRVEEEQIATRRLAAEKLIAEERIRAEAQQAVGQGVLYYGQRTGQPGTQFTGLRAGRAAEGVPDRSAVQNFQRDTFTSLDASRAIGQNPERLRQFYAELQQGSIIQANASQQMRRHGALTTEFLQALGRGEVTLAEFRYQIGSTIGKFAGWTAAATAVYGVIGALGVLTRGAKESSAGVQQLHRFIADVSETKAAEGFRAASREINVSIAEVSNAQAGFLRVYHTQAGALDAARVSLKLTKLDNLSAADSLRFLTATAQGFNLPATRLAFLGDQLANVFRKLGVPIQESAPALARSAAVVHNAGGQLTELIQLIAVARRATGQTGNTIGTAFARSAANFVTKAKSQAVFTAFGLDPKQATDDYTAFVINAIRRARTLSGPEIQKLAAAIGGPQYGARIFTGVLRGYDLLPKAAQIAGSQASGTLDRELRVKLGQIDEQLSSVGHGLERLGASLAEAGVFTPLGVALHTLTGLLTVTNDLVDAFNSLPDPLKRSVALLGEAYLGVRLLRRSGAGEALAARTGVGFLGPSEQDITRRQAISSQRRLGESLANEQERTANAAASKFAGVYTGEARIAQLGEQRAALLATEGADQLRIQTIEEEINSQRRAVNRLREEGQLLAQEEAALNTRRLEIEGTIVGLQKRRLTVEGAAALQGAPIVIPAGAGATRTIQPASESAAVRGELGQRAQRVRNTLDSLILTNAVASRNAVSVAEGGRGLGRSYQLFERAALTGSAITGRGVQAIESAGVGIRGAAGGIRAAATGLLASLGPLDVALIGSVFGFEAIHSAQERQRQRTEDLRKVFADPRTAQQAEQIRRQAEKLSQDQRGGFQRFYESAAHFVASNVPIVGASLGDAQTQQEKDRQKFDKRADQLLNERERVLRQQRTGGVAPRAFLSQIDDQFKVDIRKYKDYADLRAAVNRRIEEVLQSIEAGRNANDPRLAATIGRYRNLLGSRAPEDAANPFDEFNGVTRDFLGKLMERAAQRLQVRTEGGGSRSGPLRELAAGYITAVQRYSSGTLDDLKALTEARDQFLKGISQPIEDELQTALKLAAGNPAQTQGAYDRAITRYQNALVQLRNTREAQRSGIGKAQEQLSQYEKDLSAAQGDQTRLAPNEPRTGRANLDAIAEQIRQQRAVVKHLNTQLNGSSTAVRRAEVELQALIEDQQQAAFTARDQTRQTELAYQQSKTADKSTQIQEAITAQGKAVRDAIHTFGRTDTRTIEALTKQNELTQQAAEQAIEHSKVLGDLKTSRIDTLGSAGDIERARSDIQTIRDEIRIAKRGNSDPDKIRQLQTDLNNAQRGLAQSLKDHADALAGARFDLSIAGIIEPVEKLKKQLQFDRRQLSGLSGVERIQQLAKIRTDKTDLQQQNVNEDLDQLNFLHNIEKLTDQQYISELRKIINTRRISKSLKRQLLEQIHSLQKQDSSDVELNVGDIRLPTLYDVRRLARGGTGANRVTQVTQVNHVSIEAKGADASDVATEFERHAGTSLKAALRAGA